MCVVYVDVLDNEIENVIHRKNKDAHIINKHGRQLIEFCQSHCIIIYNGRTGKDKGDFTTTKGSIVDYVIGSVKLWQCVNRFEVLPFD